LDSLLAYFEPRTLAAGDYLIDPNQPPDEMFFIESGQVTARIEGNDGEAVRLETTRGGRAVGELGFYLGRRGGAAGVGAGPGTACGAYNKSTPMRRQRFT